VIVATDPWVRLERYSATTDVVVERLFSDLDLEIQAIFEAFLAPRGVWSFPKARASEARGEVFDGLAPVDLPLDPNPRRPLGRRSPGDEP
jgi:hypothetical protein